MCRTIRLRRAKTPANQLRKRAFHVLKLLEASAASDQRERFLVNARQRGLGAAPRRRAKTPANQLRKRAFRVLKLLVASAASDQRERF